MNRNDIGTLLFDKLGKLPIINSNFWPFGKIEVVLASNLTKYIYEASYLRSRYKDHLELSGRNEENDRKYKYNNFHYFNSTNENDRLDIIGHSDGNMIGRFTPRELAKELSSYSLRTVGVVKLQACYTGRGHTLEALRDAFYHYDIKFAYMAAPTNRVIWKYPFLKYVKGDSMTAYKVVKGNINKNFPNTRYYPHDSGSDGMDTL